MPLEIKGFDSADSAAYDVNMKFRRARIV